MSKPFKVSVSGVCENMKTVAKAGKHTFFMDEPENMGGTDAGADPLSTLLGSLISCKNVMLNLVAKEMEFHLNSAEFELEGNIDLAGLMGDPNVRTYFEHVHLNITLDTDESKERIEELLEKAASRCPVYQTLEAADVKLTVAWTTK